MKKYLNTISAFQFFQLIRFATLILTGIIFTKTALSQQAIGEYETFTFVAGAVSFFWLNGLLKALLPMASETKNKSHFLFSSFLLIQTLSLVTVGLLAILTPLFSEVLLNGKPIPATTLLLAFIALSVPANLVEYYYLIQKKNKTLVIYAVLSNLLQLIMVAGPAIFGYDLSVLLKGLVLSAALRYFWLWYILASKSQFKASAAFIGEHLKLGGPLVMATLLSGSAQFIDGFIVTSHFDEEAFAVFRYGARELPLATLLANALSNAMLSEFGTKQNLQESLQKLRQSVNRLMHFLFPTTALLLLISKPIFPVIFNADFANSASIFNVYLLLVISRLLMPQTILNGRKITKPIMAASFFELVLNVTLSLILVQFWGLPGIAMATFIAYLFEKIFLATAVKRQLGVNIAQYLPVKNYLIYSSGIVVIFIFAELIF